MRTSPDRGQKQVFYFSDPSGYVISDSGGRRRDPWVLWRCDGTGRRRYYECICEKDRQNHGTGKLLVQELIRITNEMGVSRLFLEVRESNERAIHVYEKAGFVKNGLRKNYYEDPVEHAVLMMHETVGKER